MFRFPDPQERAWQLLYPFFWALLCLAEVQSGRDERQTSQLKVDASLPFHQILSRLRKGGDFHGAVGRGN